MISSRRAGVSRSGELVVVVIGLGSSQDSLHALRAGSEWRTSSRTVAAWQVLSDAGVTDGYRYELRTSTSRTTRDFSGLPRTGTAWPVTPNKSMATSR